MPHYISLINWTEQGAKNARQTVQRTDHSAEVAEKYGLALKHAYWTTGPYDLVSIFEGPDDEAMSAYLLEIASYGNVRTTMLRAYDEEEMSGILRRIG